MNVEYRCIAAPCRSQLYVLILRYSEKTQQKLIVFFNGSDPSEMRELERKKICTLQAAVWVIGNDDIKAAAANYELKYMNVNYLRRITRLEEEKKS